MKQTFGTAEQDALRRDLTINSLFYNINKGEVEDLTGNGLKDLENGIIRTPIEPLQTFTDDPLRILRSFRFAARFSYAISPDITKALEHPSIIVLNHSSINKRMRVCGKQENLEKKVSKSRVRTETETALSHKNAFAFLKLLHDNKLLQILIKLPISTGTLHLK